MRLLISTIRVMKMLEGQARDRSHAAGSGADNKKELASRSSAQQIAISEEKRAPCAENKTATY